MTDLKMVQEWAGVREEGLPFEIRFWGKDHICDGHGCWNYYVYLHEKQFRPEDWIKIWLEPGGWHEWLSGNKPWYDYYNSAVSVNNWHGGVTFFEKMIEADTNKKYVKVGFDYAHAFDRDMGYQYDIDYVECEARNTCKSLAAYLKPLIRCGWTGKFVEPSELAQVEGYKGHISTEGAILRDASMAEWRERQDKSLVKTAVTHIVKTLEGE